MTPAEPFDWRDGERAIHFGRGRLAEAVELCGGAGYTLLTTPRAEGDAPHVVEAAAEVVHVPAGRVDEIAGDLLERVRGERLLALGGGRVIDVAKAIAAAGGGRARVAAVPTTLSGAEMTRGHRLARGAPAGSGHVRPAVVVCDPALAASQPRDALAASALNALGHAVEAPCTPRANPVATMAAHEAARLIAGALPDAGEPQRDELALAALLAGYSIDSAGYGLHHVLSQTLVRLTGIPHGSANAIMLPHSIGALAWRFPRQHEALTRALGGGEPADVAARLCAMTGATSLRELGVDADALARCADVAAARDDLDQTPPRAGRAELLALYEHAL
ncbi:MAG TPA: iron-containing alcohol dehydrogenase [Solirubrobacteraceae bacterium]|nr:iron-containing alcohol dehydrogenase [Solirubrobacteraceae bacterium]